MVDPVDATTAAKQPVDAIFTAKERERANIDIEAAHDHARAAVQSGILINGGAATAVLAYLSRGTGTPSGLLTAAAISLLLYAIGVICGAYSSWCSAQSAAYFGYMHDAKADGDTEETVKGFEDKAERYLGRHRRAFDLTITFFVVSTFWIAFAFLAVSFRTAP